MACPLFLLPEFPRVFRFLSVPGLDAGASPSGTSTLLGGSLSSALIDSYYIPCCFSYCGPAVFSPFPESPAEVGHLGSVGP